MAVEEFREEGLIMLATIIYCWYYWDFMKRCFKNMINRKKI